MKTEIMIAVLALLCIGSMAAAFVLCAKVDELNKATAEEYNLRCDEISRAAGLENEIERMRAREQCTAKAMMWYSDELFKRITENVQMEDKLSALLCPHNDHVWKDGVCVKCGRVEENK